MGARRATALVVALLFTAGIVAACGNDDDAADDEPVDVTVEEETTEPTEPPDDTTTTAPDADDEGEDEEAAGLVAEFCEAVDDFIDKAEESEANPTDIGLATEVATEALDLANMAAEVAALSPTLTAAQASQLEECEDRLDDYS